MLDFKRQIEKLETDAAECDLIAKLAVDNAKRQVFANLAEQYLKLAQAMTRALQSYSDEHGYADLAQKVGDHDLADGPIQNGQVKAP